MQNYLSIGYRFFQPLFPLGDILVTPGVDALGIDLRPLLRRYQSGDWGEDCPEDRATNNHAIENHEAILSDYPVMVDEEIIRIHIMTESDRSYTIVFLPSEGADEL